MNSLKTIPLFGCAKKNKKPYQTFPSTERQSFYTYFFDLKTLNFKKCSYQDFSTTNNLENPITDHAHNMCQHAFPFQQAVSELADKSNHLTTVSINAVLEIAVAHWTWSDQILKMIGQFHIMVGYDDRTSHQHILTKIQI